MAAAQKTPEALSLDEYEAAQKAEWSAYIAAERIYIGGALAFNPGDPVPAGHVKNKVVSSAQVTPTSEKES